MLDTELKAILKQACNVATETGFPPSEKFQIALVQSLIAEKATSEAATAAAKLLGDKIAKGLVNAALAG